MGKKYIISESQYNFILEQETSSYKHPLDFLLNKTMNLYHDEANSRLFFKSKIYDRGQDYSSPIIDFLKVKTEAIGGPYYKLKFRCNYSTKLVDGMELYLSDVSGYKETQFIGLVYNKKLIDEINLKKLISCSKPSADYTSTNKPEPNNMV
jgi:hypothetical protein